MKKTGSYLSATALGSITAVAALLIGLSGAHAQAPAPTTPLSGAGSFPGSFIVPGTNTSLHVGGTIELDTWFDTNGFSTSTSPGADAHLDAHSMAIQGAGITNGAGQSNHGTWYWTSQFSKFNFETRTPTPYGELKTYIEVDFDGSACAACSGQPSAGTTTANFNQGYLARVKQAYGTLGPFLMGQTSSLYADLDAWPDTLDAPAEAGDFMGVTDYRIPQIRYTYLLPQGWTAAGSVEMMQSAGIIDNAYGSTAATAAGPGFPFASPAALGNYNDFYNYTEKLPAFVGNIRTDQPWGHAAFHVVVAQEEFRNFSASAPVNALITPGSYQDRMGFQSNFSGHFNTIGRDKITWMLGWGLGAAQYSEALNGAQQGGGYQEGLVCAVVTASKLTCSQAWVEGANASYTHYWTDTWRSTVSGGFDHASLPNGTSQWVAAAGNVGSTAAAAGFPGASELDHYTYSTAINLLWQPVPAAQFGIENDWYHHTVWSGAHGTDDRIHFQALFKF